MKSILVTIPKFERPPFKAQNRLGWDEALALRSSPVGSAIYSHVRKYAVSTKTRVEDLKINNCVC